MDGSNLLTALFCSIVAFFVGALCARMFPDGLTVEAGSVAEWVAAMAAVGTWIVAWKALAAWRDPLRGGSKHAAAVEIAEAANLTRYYFYDARLPAYFAEEFPASYHQKKHRTFDEEADGWAYLFENRYAGLHTQIMRLATLRAKAGALLNEEAADNLDKLSRKARELHNLFRQKVSQFRSGPDVVGRWPDQNFVNRVNTRIEALPGDHTDDYSLEFEAEFASVIHSLEKFI